MENIEGFTYSGCDEKGLCFIRCITCQENQMFRSEVFVELVDTKSIPECKYCSDVEFVTNKSLYLSHHITLTDLCYTELTNRAIGKIAGMTIPQVIAFKREIGSSAVRLTDKRVVVKTATTVAVERVSVIPDSYTAPETAALLGLSERQVVRAYTSAMKKLSNLMDVGMLMDMITEVSGDMGNGSCSRHYSHMMN